MDAKQQEGRSSLGAQIVISTINSFDFRKFNAEDKVSRVLVCIGIAFGS